MASHFRKEFQSKIKPQLQKELGLDNPMAVPQITKVVINIGVGSYIRNKNKDISKIEDHMSKIAGQKLNIRKSRKSISNFKLREGDSVGLSTTLRGDRMYDFISKLVNVALPRVRDFRGISPSAFDKQGNYSLGIKEHYVFPDISIDDEVAPFSFQVTITTSATSKEHGLALLKIIGFPFKEK